MREGTSRNEVEPSRRAVEAMSRFRYGPLTMREMRTLWRTSLLPVFEEFLAAMSSKTAALPSSYFRPHDIYPNPCVLIVDAKTMWGLFERFDKRDAALVGEINAELFVPFMSKWSEVFSRLKSVYGVKTDAATAKTKLAKLVMHLREMWMCDPDDGLNDQRRSKHYRLAEDFFRSLRALECAVERANTSQALDGRRTRYSHDSEQLEVLREGRRLRAQIVGGRHPTFKTIAMRLANDPYYSRIMKGRDEKTIGLWIRRLSGYCKDHPQSV